MKVTREIFKDYKLVSKSVLKEGVFLSGYFNDLLNRAYTKANKDQWNEPKLTRLSNKAFQIYRNDLLFVFKIK